MQYLYKSCVYCSLTNLLLLKYLQHFSSEISYSTPRYLITNYSIVSFSIEIGFLKAGLTLCKKPLCREGDLDYCWEFVGWSSSRSNGFFLTGSSTKQPKWVFGGTGGDTSMLCNLDLTWSSYLTLWSPCIKECMGLLIFCSCLSLLLTTDSLLQTCGTLLSRIYF